jgi:hypothetical protein
MERFLQTVGAQWIAGKYLEGVVKQRARRVRIPRQNPHTEAGVVQAARHGLA